MSDQPQRVLLRDSGRQLVLEYADGEPARLDAEYLRVNSPSAEVQGHGKEGGTLPIGKQDVRIVKIERAGNYALRLHFDDDHDSGIYTWVYFRQLASEKQQRWQKYLMELKKLGETRDPETQVVRLIDPSSPK
ncbi:MAG: DUF971 domain-containing protein [Pseudomonadales bacterium]